MRVPNTPRLSVLIPVHGEAAPARELALLACLRSLNSQTLPPDRYEVLLVGGETAGVDLSLLRCPGRHVASTGVCSQAAAFNLGVQAADTEHVLFWESNVLASPDCLRLHLEALCALPEALCGVVGRLDPPASAGNAGLAGLLAACGLGGLGERPENGKLCPADRLPFCQVSLPRRAIMAAGMFDTRFAQPDGDVAMREFGLRLERAGGGIVSVRACAARLRRLPDLDALLGAAARRGMDEATLRSWRPDAFADSPSLTVADLSFWREPPDRLLRQVAALRDRLACRIAQLADDPGETALADPGPMRAALTGLAGMRTRQVLALIDPLLEGDQQDVKPGRVGQALVFLDAFHAWQGFVAAEATAARRGRAFNAEPAGQERGLVANTRRKRVLLATNYFWPSVGGTELLVEELGQRLMAAGYVVEVACRPHESRAASSRKGMTIHAFDCTGLLDAVGGPGAAAYLRLIVTGGFDAVIVLSHPPVWCCSLLRALPRQGRPRIIMMPSMNADDLAGWEENQQMAAVAAVLRAADVLVTVSEHGVDARILENLGLPFVFVPHAVTDEAAPTAFRQRLGIPAQTPLLACVGNFWPVKNQLGLLRIMTAAAGDWRLVLAGSPAPWADKRPYFLDCWDLCARDPRLRLIGPLPPLEAAALIREADALLVPSLGESAGPLVVLQAMAMGRPWLATPACNAVHDEAGGIIAALDRFPDAVKALLARPEAARALGETGREHWRRCGTWERSVGIFIDLIEGRDVAAGPGVDLRLPDDVRRLWHEAARNVFPEAILDRETARPGSQTPGVPPRPDNGHGATELPGVAPDKAFRFSVVTAAYNAAPWIGHMLASLTRQEFDFAANIQLVVVDDGSVDDTAELVRRVAAAYPDNVTLLQKENGGPASAKNLGLTRARGEWVTFIDADDFIAPNYFRLVDDYIRSSGFDGNVIACNTLLFIDSENYVIDGHPLSYKFKETRVVDLLAEPDYIQLFANACLVRRRTLEETGVRYDARIKPSFEDAHFLNVVLLESGDCRIAFLKDAHYLYRRRGAASGLVEGGWSHPAKYGDQVLYGYLDLVRQARRKLGHVPAFVQNLVLYEAHWYLQRLLKGSFPCPLSAAEQEAFFDAMALAFAHLDTKQVLLSTLPALDLRSRIAMLRAFKREHFNAMPFVVAEVAPGGAEARLVHWATDPVPYALFDAAGPAPIPFEKQVEHRVGTTVLCYEQHSWVPLRSGKPCWPTADGQRPGVFCRGRLLEELDPTTVGEAFYLPLSRLSEEQRALVDAKSASGVEACRRGWVLMDRVHTADDSAEHLCRWLLRTHPEQPVHFVLESKAADWGRLAREGFPLLAYGSREHWQALANASWLISTHVDEVVIDPLHTRESFGQPDYKVAFLQHGIIMNDLSPWLNTVPLDCMVASTRPEYASLLGGLYKFSRREIILSGLPRHDALLARAGKRKPGRTILFCPTWRQHLRRKEAHIPGLSEGEARIFRQSDFFRAWSAVTGSRSLARLAHDHGYKFLFLPHPEMSRFLPLFPRSPAFTFLDWGALASVQAVLVSSAAAVSDYSSLPFDIAYLGRPVAYYHFPETPDVYTSKNWGAGYFDYETQGLGPVFQTPGALEAWIGDRLRDGCRREPLYDARADAFFTLRDGQNCRRVYEAVMARS